MATKKHHVGAVAARPLAADGNQNEDGTNTSFRDDNRRSDDFQHWHRFPDIAGRILFFLYATAVGGTLTGVRMVKLLQQVKSDLECSEAAFYQTVEELEKNRLIIKSGDHKYKVCALTRHGYETLGILAKKFDLDPKDLVAWQNWGVRNAEEERDLEPYPIPKENKS
jgi:hypothetical protein